MQNERLDTFNGEILKMQLIFDEKLKELQEKNRNLESELMAKDRDCEELQKETNLKIEEKEKECQEREEKL
eukprot:CAMPEP_0202962950 /NCGR_PEP_ID=MMETSP1396-20130829/6967_1 /ASSEMBLY_ACC=CAM_ASM_000872 /TAXON_ID= /ORGANISM="Pseudokeronopsis sp., Strain Brazil" /LENGTH=70 /DNA_ID=CAMNT_0049683805 /DNA_START=429 /DNA_END=641 /DNA_ORIENTATION=+